MCLPGVKRVGICRGVVPFVVLQRFGLGLVFPFPQPVASLPAAAYGN